jgi:hypothetical protein
MLKFSFWPAPFAGWVFKNNIKGINMKKVLLIIGVLVAIGLGCIFYSWYDYLKADYKLWPDGVVYYKFVGDEWETYKIEKHRIKICMSDWERESCIKFIELEYPGDNDIYCRIVLGTKNSAKKGFIKNSFFQFNKIRGASYGTIRHELGHVIGLIHEHQRPDRDKYIKINWKNIKLLRQHNFWKLDNPYIDYDKHPYDYYSIMHYSCSSKGIGDKKSIQSLDSNYSCDEIGKRGKRGKITEFDYMKVNAMYNDEACK